MSFISIRYKSDSTKGEFFEKIYAGKEVFDILMLTELLNDVGINIRETIFIKGEQLNIICKTMENEVKRLLREKDKGTLIGQYPPHAIRNLDMIIFDEPHTFNIRNQWHDYIITLYDLYETFSKTSEEGGEVGFLH